MLVTLLTDYGTADEFAGVLHGVIARVAPGARVIDVTHGIPRYEVRHGALVLRNALPFFPVGIHVAIVDPQVGTERRAVAIGCADGRVLVGPDNGLLSPACEQAGGVAVAVDISRSPHRLEPVSSTFHGRDVFAPVAAAVAAGAPLEGAGDPLHADELATIQLPRASIEPNGDLIARALLVDGYGNVTLGVTHDELTQSALRLGRGAEVEVGGTRRRAVVTSTFADVEPGELMLYEDASRSLALAINRGDAAGSLGLGRDDEVRIRAL